MAVAKSSWLVAFGGVACGIAGLVVALGAQDSGPKPQCTNCPGTYLSEGEIKEYVAKAMKERLIDQQIRTSRSARRTSASASCIGASSTNRRPIRWPSTTW